MKLTIIIPVYNEERYLARCLNSIKPNPDVEVLIIDDGSEDNSWAIAQEYEGLIKHGYVVKAIKRTQTSFGVSFARNIGLNEAKGEYVTFLDSDDEYCPGAIDNMLQEIKDHEGEDIIQFEHNRPHCFNPSGYYKVDALPKKWVLVWNKVYRRDFLYDNGISFPYGLQFEEDRIFNLKAFNHCPCFYHSAYQTVIKHSDNKQSLCKTVDPYKLFDLTKALMEMLKSDDTIPEVKNVTRQCISDLYESRNAKRCFGGTV